MKRFTVQCVRITADDATEREVENAREIRCNQKRKQKAR